MTAPARSPETGPGAGPVSPAFLPPTVLSPPTLRPGAPAQAREAARNQPSTTPERELVEVPLGRRTMVLGDLLLAPEATQASLAVTAELIRTLDQWQGPGLVVIAGNLFNGPADEDHARQAFDAHTGLEAAVRAFIGEGGRRLVVLPGWREARDHPGAQGPDAFLAKLGAEVRPSIDLALSTAAGPRRVAVRAGAPGTRRGCGAETLAAGRPWLAGADRLEDPAASTRFVTSRTLYRRLARYSWLLVLPALAALGLRMSVVVGLLERLVGSAPGPRRALSHAYAAVWPDRLGAMAVATIVVLALFGAVQVGLSRPVWRALGGDDASPGSGPDRLEVDGDEALDRARALVGGGDYDGVVVGGRLGAQLVHLGTGFFACPGGATEIVREHGGRIGLPPVFVSHCQVSLLELETGADLHARLLVGDAVLPTPSSSERLAAKGRPVVHGRRPVADVRPALVAAWPQGHAWPPPGEVIDEQARARRVRRVAAAALSAAGVCDLLEAVRPPAAGHLRAVEQILSLGDVETARALMAFAAIALVMVARGLLRGQRRAWLVAVGVLSATVVLRLLGGALVVGMGLNVAVLCLLLVERRRFCAAIDHRSSRSAASTLAIGGALAVAGAVAAVEVSHPRHQALPSLPVVVTAVVERLVGVQSVALPARINTWVAPSLLGVGCALALVAAFLATRPVVDRRLSAGRGPSSRRVAELRARDIVRRHGNGSLDYFSLRDDKEWFFHRDTLVAYAVHGGVCLVSPDPIGPESERVQAWSAFRRFADQHGWAVGVVGASEQWLPVFRASGMRFAYIGDEAVVNVQGFTLAGNDMKGLRQACSRVERKGYRVAFLDPATLDQATVGPLLDLIGRNRRGGKERGFSMTLSRVFDPRDAGLLLTVVYGPDGAPAALCQFVPSRAIGGYSLDLMRRDPGDHPNGILDFALCSTIEHLRQRGCKGVSLNFAALRATLDGENGDGVTQRMERWALRRMSGVLQIESLWRFNAKYRPTWQPRYVVFDCAEQFLPTVVNIVRAESLSEVPLIGRLLTAGAERRAASRPGADEQSAISA